MQSGQAEGFVRASKDNHRLLVGTGGERTENMLFMVVTLDVSKVSGWLNATAHCRTKWGEVMQNGVGCKGHHRYIMPPSHIRCGLDG